MTDHEVDSTAGQPGPAVDGEQAARRVDRPFTSDRPALPKTYDPARVEGDVYADWEAAGVFHADPDDPGEPFAIVIPPPNVTGSLHIGHALNNTIQDAVIRRARLEGKNAVWIPGTDHAGIATQNVVERQLAAEGRTRHDLGREAFLERVWQWVEEAGGIILDQLRRLGCSLDWDREVFTFDDRRSVAVRETFVTLYQQGLIYRGHRLINWCPRCATALSDIEVEHQEVAGELVSFTYPYAEGDGGIEVATTRAETMLGDTAVAVHPDDDRYADVVGRRVRHPVFDRQLPVVADDYVDPEFGTGAVKITPGHDPNDFDVGQRHNLAVLDIMTDQAAINDRGGRFAGLDRFAARTAVKEALDAAGLLVAVEDHTHQVGHCDRCATMVEPRLSEQWFVEVRPLAEAAIQAVAAGRLRFVPQRFTRGFVDWLENLHDWCISRQIWWGHRIPAWYCPDGHVTVSTIPPDACAECASPTLVQDEDVLDTWFSSQLWPFSVFGWPEQTAELATWYPTAVLVTSYDINTFWVSRMLMAGLRLLDEEPFRVVHNHGLVRDDQGRKMSKSIGNVIDPLEFVDRYGADALRFALLSRCSPGQDVPLAEEWVEGARRFANKLWNVARLVLSNLDGVRPGPLPADEELAVEDRWVLSRLEACRTTVDSATSRDRLAWSTGADAIYHFTWDELADWYLEAAKVRLYGADGTAANTARRVLAVVLDDLLRLTHPFMPFITEALWRALTGAGGGRDSLAVASWPVRRRGRDRPAEATFGVIQEIVGEIRRFRSEHQVPPSRTIPATVVTDAYGELAAHDELLTTLAGLSQLVLTDREPAGAGPADQPAPDSAAADQAGLTRVVFSGGEIFIPLVGVVDVDAELERLRKELATAEAEERRAAGKLANRQFVDRAPDEVVQRERDKHEDWTRIAAETRSEIAQLESLRR